MKKSAKKTKLVIVLETVVALVAVVAVSLQSTALCMNFRKTDITDYTEKSQEYTRLYAEKVELMLNAYLSDLDVYVTSDIAKTGNSESIHKWIKSIKDSRSKNFDYVAYVDSNGGFHSDNDTSTNIRDRDYFKAIMEQGAATFIDCPVESKITGKKIIHVCKAVKDSSGKNIGFFTGIVETSTINQIIEKARLGKTGVSFMLGTNSELIATSGSREEISAIIAGASSNTNIDYAPMFTGEPGATWVSFGKGKTRQKFLTVFNKINGAPWCLMFIITEKEVLQRTTLRTISVAILGIMIILAITITIGLLVIAALKPLTIVETSINEISSGHADLTKRIFLKHNNNTEIGRLVDNFNGFTNKLHEIMKETKDSKDDLVTVGNQLNTSVVETGAAITQITQNIKGMNSCIIEQGKSVSQTAGAVNQIATNIESLNRMIEAQSSGVEEASAAVEEMIGNINAVNNSVNKMATEFTVLEDKSKNGVLKQQAVNERIKTIETESKALQEANSVISSIAEQTNLLAMNAAIEAAHAGEAGKGFSVVADEIRKLSETSSSQSKTIGLQLKKIMDLIESIVDASRTASESFQDVANVINSTNTLVQQIKLAMAEQEEGSKQITQALKLMNDSTTEVKLASDEMSDGNKQILSEIQNLQDTTINMKSSMEEITIGSDRVNTMGNGLALISDKTNKSIQRIGQEVDRFIV